MCEQVPVRSRALTFCLWTPAAICALPVGDGPGTMTLPHILLPDPGALEAGAKLVANHEAVVADVLKNAGLLQVPTATLTEG